MFIKLPSSVRRRAGAALVEYMFGIGVGALVLLSTTSLSLYTGKSFAGLANYMDLDTASRNALDRLTREIRQVNSLTGYSTNQITFSDYDGSVLSYTYDPTARTLTRDRNGAVSVLLTECDALNFSIYQRNPIGGTYDQYPTAIPASAKIVVASWSCSRKVVGAAINTESVQTAKIVIRKQ